MPGSSHAERKRLLQTVAPVRTLLAAVGSSLLQLEPQSTPTYVIGIRDQELPIALFTAVCVLERLEKAVILRHALWYAHQARCAQMAQLKVVVGQGTEGKAAIPHLLALLVAGDTSYLNPYDTARSQV